MGLAFLGAGLSASGCGARTGLLAQQCVALDAFSDQSSLVVFVMLDTSGSMAFKTSEGESKAKAVRDALAKFFADPGSAGIGIAESFFPVLLADVPPTCLTDADCGEPGACWQTINDLCLPSGDKGCTTDADCVGTSNPSDTCHEVGICADDPGKNCILGYASSFCNPDVDCESLRLCLNRPSCDAGAYSVPVVDVGLLPSARTELLLALDTRTQQDATPTLPALKGALQAAGAWQDQHLRDKAIVLLATDGLPTACDDAIPPGPETTLGIPKVVEVAKSGVESGVQTYVVGVFAPDEQADAEVALSQISQAGGTDSAFIVTTDKTVSERLVQTFNEVRTRAHGCEYPIPWPAEGGIDPNTLTVTLTGPAGQTSVVPRVPSVEACGSSNLGFYFDRQPEPGLLPHRVVLCPASCGATPPSVIHMKGQCRAIEH